MRVKDFINEQQTPKAFFIATNRLSEKMARWHSKSGLLGDAIYAFDDYMSALQTSFKGIQDQNQLTDNRYIFINPRDFTGYNTQNLEELMKNVDDLNEVYCVQYDDNVNFIKNEKLKTPWVPESYEKLKRSMHDQAKSFMQDEVKRLRKNHGFSLLRVPFVTFMVDHKGGRLVLASANAVNTSFVSTLKGQKVNILNLDERAKIHLLENSITNVLEKYSPNIDINDFQQSFENVSINEIQSQSYGTVYCLLCAAIDGKDFRSKNYLDNFIEKSNSRTKNIVNNVIIKSGFNVIKKSNHLIILNIEDFEVSSIKTVTSLDKIKFKNVDDSTGNSDDDDLDIFIKDETL